MISIPKSTNADKRITKALDDNKINLRKEYPTSVKLFKKYSFFKAVFCYPCRVTLCVIQTVTVHGCRMDTLCVCVWY